MIAEAVDLYTEIRSARLVAHRLRKDGKGLRHSTVSRWGCAMVWKVVRCLKKIGMRGIGDHTSTDEVIGDGCGIVRRHGDRPRYPILPCGQVSPTKMAKTRPTCSEPPVRWRAVIPW